MIFPVYFSQDRCHRIGQEKHVVVYRLLTAGSVEIDMMKRQISKKKLERLTIHGGDFRKAGKRHSQSVTIEDLRRLLEDDVNLDRKSSNDDVMIEKHISDVELDLIMDREKLFFEDDNFDNYRPQVSPNSTAMAATEEDGTMVPAEGQMYDIVNTGAEGMVLSLT